MLIRIVRVRQWQDYGHCCRYNLCYVMSSQFANKYLIFTEHKKHTHANYQIFKQKWQWKSKREKDRNHLNGGLGTDLVVCSKREREGYM